MMFNEYREKLKKLKEDLIYAMEENYDGELTIEDVTDSPYVTLSLKQDSAIIGHSSNTYADTVALLIDRIEKYFEEIDSFEPRTVHRNRLTVEQTLDDLCRTASILILSIRQNNAAWQVILNENMPKEEEEIEEELSEEEAFIELLKVLADVDKETAKKYIQNPQNKRVIKRIIWKGENDG